MADLAILVLALPNELYHLWQHYPWRLGDFACDVKVVVQEAITYVSILTILGIGSEMFKNKLNYLYMLAPFLRSKFCIISEPFF